MSGFKVCLLFFFLSIISFTNGDDVIEDLSETTTILNEPTTAKNGNSPPITNSDPPFSAAPRPPFGVNNPPLFGINNSPPNIFQHLFNQFLRPLKNNGKTYGPNIIAIIGDKPYISMEVFHKFSPLKWLMHAFQGKIQNICGFLAPANQPELPNIPNPPNIFEQLLMEESQKPLTGLPQPIPGSAPMRIYDISALYKGAKRRQ